jgi:hypothetical protein
MIKILLVVTALMNAGFDCVITPEITVCTNDTTMEWTILKNEDGEVITAKGKTT